MSFFESILTAIETNFPLWKAKIIADAPAAEAEGKAALAALITYAPAAEAVAGALGRPEAAAGIAVADQLATHLQTLTDGSQPVAAKVQALDSVITTVQAIRAGQNTPAQAPVAPAPAAT